jgi:Flp pilus assembly protein TadD
LLNFSEILLQRHRCDLAPPYLQRAERRLPNNYYVDVAWGRTLACLGRFDQAIERLQAAARLRPCSRVYEWMGLVYAQMGRSPDAGEMLKKAVALGPGSATAHGSLALWYEKNRSLEDAEREYRAALSLNRGDSWALKGWMRVHAMRSDHDAGF